MTAQDFTNLEGLVVEQGALLSQINPVANGANYLAAVTSVLALRENLFGSKQVIFDVTDGEKKTTYFDAAHVAQIVAQVYPLTDTSKTEALLQGVTSIAKQVNVSGSKQAVPQNPIVSGGIFGNCGP